MVIPISYLLAQIWNGLFYGIMFALAACGFSLIFGTMNVLNFAHGALYMAGAYATYYVFTFLGLPAMISALLGAGIVFLFAVGIEKGLMDPLTEHEGWEHDALVITLGLSVVLENGALLVFGAEWKGIESDISGQITIGGIIFGYERLLIMMISLVLLIALWLFLQRTALGRALRATAQDKDAASLVGIDIRKVYFLTYGLSAALIAAAGGLLAPILKIYPTVGGHPFLMSFVIVVIGGLGSVKGSIFSALLVGITRSLATMILSAAWADVILFFMMILVLTVRPRGLFGER